MSFLESPDSMRLMPKMLLIIISLVPCILLLPLPRLVIKLSEAMFYLISGDILYQMILKRSTRLSPRSQHLSLLLMPTFAITLFDKVGFTDIVKREHIISIVVSLLSMFFILWVCSHLKVFSNLVQTRSMLKRSKHHLGPGLARTFFR